MTSTPYRVKFDYLNNVVLLAFVNVLYNPKMQRYFIIEMKSKNATIGSLQEQTAGGWFPHAKFGEKEIQGEVCKNGVLNEHKQWRTSLSAGLLPIAVQTAAIITKKISSFLQITCPFLLKAYEKV